MTNKKIIYLNCIESGYDLLESLLRAGVVIDHVISLSPEQASRHKVSGYKDFSPLCDKHRIPLYYPEKYAGTTDVCGRYMGEDSIIDFKQTNKPKREEWIDDYFVQLAAYALAHNKIYDTKINQGVILMCSKDGMYQRFTVSGQRFMDFKDKWQRRLEQYYGEKREL